MSDASAQPNLVSKLALALQRGNPLEDMVRPLLEMLHLTTGLESTYLTRIDAQGGKQCVLFALNRGALDICARLGGDEFVCLIDVTLADDADAGAIWRARLEAATRGRFDLGGQVIVDYPGASVGLVTVEPDDDNPDTVLDRADSAMYAVKRSRRSGQPLSSPVQKARFRTG